MVASVILVHRIMQLRLQMGALVVVQVVLPIAPTLGLQATYGGKGFGNNGGDDYSNEGAGGGGGAGGAGTNGSATLGGNGGAC